MPRSRAGTPNGNVISGIDSRREASFGPAYNSGYQFATKRAFPVKLGVSVKRAWVSCRTALLGALLGRQEMQPRRAVLHPRFLPESPPRLTDASVKLAVRLAIKKHLACSPGRGERQFASAASPGT